MQEDLFTPSAPAPDLVLEDHASPDYGPRTTINAQSADITLAFAVDFTTAGEKLTARVAGKRYRAIRFGQDVEEAAEKVVEALRQHQARTVNIAGNGSYTLLAQGISQEQANQWLFDVLRRVREQMPIDRLRSGGQTGIDTAGLVAGLALGIPSTGLYPKGFRIRLKDGRDIHPAKDKLEKALRQQAEVLRPRSSEP